MGDYIISCCSTADVTDAYLKEKNIEYICFHYYLDDKAYKDDLYQSMSPQDFYQAMLDGAMTKTSQVNAEEFTQYFRKFLEQGRMLFILHYQVVFLVLLIQHVLRLRSFQRNFLIER